MPIGDVEGPQNSFSSPGNYVTSPPTVYRYPSTPGLSLRQWDPFIDNIFWFGLEVLQHVKIAWM